MTDMDYNDMQREQGSEAVRASIESAAPPEEAHEETIERLAKLSPLEYDQEREQIAKRLNVRVSTLDNEVAKQRAQAHDDTGATTGPQEAEPWHSPVDGQELYTELTSTFGKYLALQKHQADALALWSIFSYCIDANNIAPKLLIYSPEKRCGKTTLLDVLNGLVWKPLPASNITSAAIFRVIQHIGGTLVIDEADTFINNKNSDINGIINSGHRKSMAFVFRCEGDDHKPEQFSTWAPTIIAMIGKPQDTIVDRSIQIEMKRKKPEDTVSRFIPHKVEAELKALASKICRWGQDNFTALRGADPETPKGLNDRAADNWRPLLAIADQIGGPCPETARLAAITLSQDNQDEEDGTAATMLLADIRDIFESQPSRQRISTGDILKELHEMEDRPWPEWNRGKEISARQVARLLKPYNIKPKVLHFHYGKSRGYERDMLEDAFARYLSVTPLQQNKNNGLEKIPSVTQATQVTDKNTTNPLNNNDSYGVTDTEVF